MPKLQLITRLERKAKNVNNKNRVTLAKRAGIKSLGVFNRSAAHPHMEPCGSEKPDVYVLGGFPSFVDDRNGEPFSDTVGEYFRDFLSGNDVRYNNVFNTRLVTDDQKLKDYQIEAYRTSVEKDIERTKPTVVVLCGYLAAKWGLESYLTNRAGTFVGLEIIRGHKLPIRFGTHLCWCVCTYDPKYVIEQKGDRWYDKYEEVMTRDLKLAEQLTSEKPPKKIEDKEEELLKGCQFFEQPCADFFKALSKLLKKGKPLSMDFETTGLKPYASGGNIISLAIGNAKEVLSVYLLKNGKRHKETVRVLETVLDGGCPLIFHNLLFDLEWFIWALDDASIAHQAVWHDTMQQAYTLNEKRGGHNLNFVCYKYTGIALKKYSNLDVTRLIEYPPEKVLRYNALDVKYTHLVHLEQHGRILAQGMGKAYATQMRSIQALAAAQYFGFPVDVTEVRRHKKEFQKEVNKFKKQIQDIPEVRAYVRKHGEFNPASDKQLGSLLFDLGYKQVLIGKGKYKVNADNLKTIGHPLSQAVQKLRKPSKSLSTYVLPLVPGHEKSVIFDDNKIHPSFETIGTTTGRLSCRKPNAQNYSKRGEGKKLRTMFAPPAGHVILACDYGQLEARVIACLSKDKEFTNALWTGYDVHMAWAKRIVEDIPDLLEERYPNIEDEDKALGEWRGEIKNTLVFPAFYGASLPSIARYLSIDEDVMEPIYAEFWETFSGVKRWQDNLTKFYRKNFYVETPTGRRRHGPLTKNEYMNSGVQGGSSDIVMDAMYRLSRLAAEKDLPHLQPRLNIHDDLTFVIPESKLESAKKTIVHYMLKTPFKWARHVPVQIEVSVGKNWCDMKELGRYASNEVFKNDPKFQRKRK